MAAPSLRTAGSSSRPSRPFVLLSGRYSLDRYRGKHYAMARNLTSHLQAAYDEALSRFDVLVMPTLPLKATELPEPGCPMEVYVARALEMIPNTAPFDVTDYDAAAQKKLWAAPETRDLLTALADRLAPVDPFDPPTIETCRIQ